MAISRSNAIRSLYKLGQLQPHSYSNLGSSRSYSNAIIRGPQVNCQRMPSFFNKDLNSIMTHERVLHTTMAAELSLFMSRPMSTNVKPSPQVRQRGGMQVAMLSPGIIYEPYGPREPISFLQRWFTRRGWRRTKEDVILELKNAYAVSKLRKTGYSKHQFYKEAFDIYKEVNKLMADGDKSLLRKLVTENMYSALKNEIKQRESVWSKIYLELIEPAVKIRTLRARLIGVDRNDLNKVFIQLTLEILTKQKFEAYNSKGAVVAGDRNKEVLVRDIWVFEKSLFHPGAYWRLCGRICL